VETINIRQPEFNNNPMATHQQTGKPNGPEIQIPLRQPTDMHLQLVRHIVVVVAFIPQRAEQIEYPGTRIFALFAKVIFKVSWEEFEEIHFRSDDFLRDGFEAEQCFGWGLAGLEFEVV
jgi:hypothetical protein